MSWEHKLWEQKFSDKFIGEIEMLEQSLATCRQEINEHEQEIKFHKKQLKIHQDDHQQLLNGLNKLSIGKQFYLTFKAFNRLLEASGVCDTNGPLKFDFLDFLMDVAEDQNLNALIEYIDLLREDLIQEKSK